MRHNDKRFEGANFTMVPELVSQIIEDLLNTLKQETD